MIVRQLTKEEQKLIKNNVEGKSLRSLGLVNIPKNFLSKPKVEYQKKLGGGL